ncbi:3-mercaptopyruvate sulfurtransferase-like [Fundulus diaphanus]
MFRVFGLGSVSVLDGGLKNWLAEGHPVTSDYRKPERRDFQASLNQSWVKSFEDVLENIQTKQVQVVDARSAGRFRGTEPEPREDIQSGHFPGAINMPYTSFLDSSGKHHNTEALTKLFKNAGVDLEKPIWASCGSGVTACHVALAADRLGLSDLCLYDGAWVEWFKRVPPELIISEGTGKKA